MNWPKTLSILLFLSGCSFFQSSTTVPPTSLLVPAAEKAPLSKIKEYSALSSGTMVVTQSSLSTKVALEMIEKGGNLFDAAIAASFLLAVYHPHSAGPGGGGFALFYTPEMSEPLTLDFREMAPKRAFAEMFLGPNDEALKNKSIAGSWSVAVPGMVAGMIELHQKYAKLPLPTLLEPAIKLAEEGFPIYPDLAEAIKKREAVLKRYPGSKAIFFNENSENPKEEGDLLIQEDLAKTLKMIADKGNDGFYKGQVAKLQIQEIERLGGLVTAEDLANYKVKYRNPVKGTYLGNDIYSMSPPSSGGTHILQLLNMAEKIPITKWGPYNSSTIHHLTSAMQLVYADRAKYMGDTDFTKIPLKGLLSKEYAQSLVKKIPANRTLDQYEVAPGIPDEFESDQTHNITLADSKGSVFISTQTINGPFGSGIVVPGTGIILNNEMDDFAAKVGVLNQFGAVGGFNNLVAPYKRPLSSMSPTLVMRKRKPLLALGAPGGTRIITCIFHTLINVLAFERPLFTAIHSPRYHHQWYPDVLEFESEQIPSSVNDSLKKMGHKISVADTGCRIQAIAWEPKGLHGVSDLRGEGSAQGINRE